MRRLAASTVLSVFILLSECCGNEWNVLKGKHFLVRYRSDLRFAEKALARAETAYSRITADLGFTRYDDFWLWDKRAKIYIHDSRDEFMKATGAPIWAGGRASRTEKELSTFREGGVFDESALLHEMAHLILREFVGSGNNVPLWLHEGVAVWAEKKQAAWSVKYLSRLASENRLPAIRDLTAADMRKESERGAVRRFYEQSGSLAAYLITEHGQDRFAKFCRELGQGKQLDDALRVAYPDTIGNMEKLEERWKRWLLEAGK